ncbi:hypothetical protein JCM10296v2_002490 [Rhodotorula toruloides]
MRAPENKGRVLVVPFDVDSEESVKAEAEKLKTDSFLEGGALDAVVVNAGVFVGGHKPPSEMTMDDVRANFRTNVEGAIFTVQPSIHVPLGDYYGGDLHLDQLGQRLHYRSHTFCLVRSAIVKHRVAPFKGYRHGVVFFWRSFFQSLAADDLDWEASKFGFEPTFGAIKTMEFHGVRQGGGVGGPDGREERGGGCATEGGGGGRRGRLGG